MTLDEFLNSKLKNHWLESSDYKFYVRRGFHYIEGKIEKTFDLATIEAKNQGKGKFKEFLKNLEQDIQKAGFNIIFVENVLTPYLATSLMKKGYKAIEVGGISSYYKYL